MKQRQTNDQTQRTIITERLSILTILVVESNRIHFLDSQSTEKSIGNHPSAIIHWKRCLKKYHSLVNNDQNEHYRPTTTIARFLSLRLVLFEKENRITQTKVNLSDWTFISENLKFEHDTHDNKIIFI